MTFDAYWPYYLRHHTRRANRLFHFVGWLVVSFGLAGALVTRDLRVLAFGVMTSYALAWTGHLLFEREVPETWKRPILANIASLRMFVLMATGRLEGHLVRHGIVTSALAPESKSNRVGTSMTLWLVFAYSAVLAALVVLRVLVGDRSALLFAINSLSLYGFVPLPLLVIAGLALRRASVLVVSAVGVLVWLWLWGGLFLPRANAAPAKPSVVVLSYNALGFNPDAADTIRVIRDSGADLVALQELNPETAHLIERELGTTYPHRWLEPRVGVTGGGILSKHPLVRARTDALPGGWVSKPMVASVDFAGVDLTFVRFHALSGPAAFREREQAARTLADFARSHRGPLIVAGDLNATDQNGAYTIVTRELHDAWRRAGWGFGHTFPGRPTPQIGGSRPVILGIPVPMWLVRIDYVFSSADFEAVSSRLAAYGEASDHRGVVATLAFR